MNRVMAALVCLGGLIVCATSVEGVFASMFIGALAGSVAVDLWEGDA